MIFEIFSPKNFCEKIGVFAQNKAKLCKNWIITLVFEKTPIFSPKIGKNCDRKIDPYIEGECNNKRKVPNGVNISSQTMSFRFLKYNSLMLYVKWVIVVLPPSVLAIFIVLHA
jgi:hypothetical protein